MYELTPMAARLMQAIPSVSRSVTSAGIVRVIGTPVRNCTRYGFRISPAFPGEITIASPEQKISAFSATGIRTPSRPSR